MKIEVEIPDHLLISVIEKVTTASFSSEYSKGEGRRLIEDRVSDAVRAMDFGPLISEAITRLAKPTVDRVVEGMVRTSAKEACKRLRGGLFDGIEETS